MRNDGPTDGWSSTILCTKPRHRLLRVDCLWVRKLAASFDGVTLQSQQSIGSASNSGRR